MKISRVSATQVTAFRDCPRKWYLRYVEGLKTPQTAAMILGEEIHKAIEIYLTTGKNNSKYADHVNAAKPYLPQPMDPDVDTEVRIAFPVYPGGPLWLGFIDLLINSESLVIHDHKTISDFVYCKTEEDIVDDVQLTSYAAWANFIQQRERGVTTDVVARLLYLHTRRKTCECRTRLVQTTLTPSQIATTWGRSQNTVRSMVDVAANVARVEDLTPTTSSCGKYGGCPYRSRCGLVIETNPGRGRKRVDMGFLDRLRAATVTPAAAAAPGNGVPLGIVPGDAAIPTTAVAAPVGAVVALPTSTVVLTVPAAAPAPAAAVPAPRKRRTKAEIAAAKAAEEAAKATASVAPADAGHGEEVNTTWKLYVNTDTGPLVSTEAPASAGFVLYVDCWPVKGCAIVPVLFDDWVRGVITDINAEVKDSVVDYRLLGFSQEKLALQAGLEKWLPKIPPALVVSTASGLGKDALQTLIPHAAVVVRALR